MTCGAAPSCGRRGAASCVAWGAVCLPLGQAASPAGASPMWRAVSVAHGDHHRSHATPDLLTPAHHFPAVTHRWLTIPIRRAT